MNIAHPPPPPDHAAAPLHEFPFNPAAVIVQAEKLNDSLTSRNRTPPPAHPAAPVICHPPAHPPAPQYHCKNHPKCHIHPPPAHPAPAFCPVTHPADVTTFITLYHPDHEVPGADHVYAAAPAPPNHEIDIVPPLITNLPLHLITATHPLVGAPENVSVPPVIVIDE